MDDASIATLGRALLRLGRANATGWLHVLARHRGAIAMREGRPVSIRSANGGEPLGDLLAGDDAATRASLARSFEGPVGRAAVVRGLATPGAVSDAVRRQMRGRLARWLSGPIRKVRFVQGRVGRSPFEEPPTAADLVLSSLRRCARDAPPSDLRALLQKRFVASPHLESLREATLAPWESAMLTHALAVGGRGAKGSELVVLTRDTERGLRTLHGWHLLGLLGTADVARRDHSTLLRKRHQLRRRASHARLLDLTEPANADSPRRAMQALATKVHPDRFDESLADTSREVMQALVAAARALDSSR